MGADLRTVAIRASAIVATCFTLATVALLAASESRPGQAMVIDALGAASTSPYVPAPLRAALVETAVLGGATGVVPFGISSMPGSMPGSFPPPPGSAPGSPPGSNSSSGPPRLPPVPAPTASPVPRLSPGAGPTASPLPRTSPNGRPPTPTPSPTPSP